MLSLSSNSESLYSEPPPYESQPGTPRPGTPASLSNVPLVFYKNPPAVEEEATSFASHKSDADEGNS